MNTILITGTAKNKIDYQFDNKINPIGFKVEYDVIIWAASEGEQIQFITSKKQVMSSHVELWAMAKNKASEYLKNELLTDGAYTQYLDHLIIL